MHPSDFSLVMKWVNVQNYSLTLRTKKTPPVHKVALHNFIILTLACCTEEESLSYFTTAHKHLFKKKLQAVEENEVEWNSPLNPIWADFLIECYQVMFSLELQQLKTWNKSANLIGQLVFNIASNKRKMSSRFVFFRLTFLHLGCTLTLSTFILVTRC